jgi:hypothetical protein
LTGKSVIVGVRHVDAAGEETGRTQYVGCIRSFTHQAAAIELEDGTTMSLPPSPHGFRWARPGRYTLSSTGRVVEDPDTVTRWISRERARSAEPDLRLVGLDDPGDDGEIVA